MADQVRAAHLLIKHAGSRNPVSRRTGAPVTLAPADALAELRSYEDRIRAEGVAAAFPRTVSEPAPSPPSSRRASARPDAPGGRLPCGRGRPRGEGAPPFARPPSARDSDRSRRFLLAQRRRGATALLANTTATWGPSAGV